VWPCIVYAGLKEKKAFGAPVNSKFDLERTEQVDVAAFECVVFRDAVMRNFEFQGIYFRANRYI